MPLSKESIKVVQGAAREAGDHLKGRLPPCKFLKKRNSHAHVYERLKAMLGVSYKECDDSDLPIILEIIAWYREHPC